MPTWAHLNVVGTKTPFLSNIKTKDSYMERRQFIRITAGTTAALILARLTSAGQAGGRIINTPDEVWAQTGDQWVKMVKGNGNRYTYRDLLVKIRDNGGAQAVDVQSPILPLQAVRFKWKHSFRDGT